MATDGAARMMGDAGNGGGVKDDGADVSSVISGGIIILL